MDFDIRWPIGALFLALGAILAVTGVIAHPLAPGGLNVDLAWGLALAAFGILMLLLAALARRRGA